MFVAQRDHVMQIIQDHNESGILENTKSYYYLPKPSDYENKL